MTTDQWKEYQEWLKEVLINGYKSVYLEDTEEWVEKTRIRTEKARLHNVQNLRDIKLEEIEGCKKIIRRLKLKITISRSEYESIAQEVADTCQGNIIRWELLIKETDLEWIRTHFLKNLENTKRGYYGTELEHYQKWLKHLKNINGPVIYITLRKGKRRNGFTEILFLVTKFGSWS